jgi:hypothetical protein
MAVDELEGLDPTERLLTPAEMAQRMGVDEADVLAWIERGGLDVQRRDDGEPWLPIREHREIGRSADGAAGFEAGLTFYSGPRDRQLLADVRAERRARERDACMSIKRPPDPSWKSRPRGAELRADEMADAIGWPCLGVLERYSRSTMVTNCISRGTESTSSRSSG